MIIRQSTGRVIQLLLIFLFALLISACTLKGAPEENLDVTDVPTNTPVPSRTSAVGLIPTAVGATALPIPTQRIFPTQAQLPPTSAFVPLPPTSTPRPTSVFILSPIPGNVVAGNVQVIGSASHPQFLQYQLEYGPDPNPNNLWFQITGAVQSPVSNGLLGIWNTTTINDSLYQLRLRVFLRDGSNWGNVSVNNIRVQNQAPTAVPTNTPVIPRPIAAFTQNLTTGNAPLNVTFTNQSSGQITNYLWNFGDGTSSIAINPAHTFSNPGTFTVSLTVAGPGGTSNVSRQITVQSVSAPVAAFIQDKTEGEAPLQVQFTSQSTGQIDTYEWNFGDGESSAETSP